MQFGQFGQNSPEEHVILSDLVSLAHFAFDNSFLEGYVASIVWGVNFLRSQVRLPVSAIIRDLDVMRQTHLVLSFALFIIRSLIW